VKSCLVAVSIGLFALSACRDEPSDLDSYSRVDCVEIAGIVHGMVTLASSDTYYAPDDGSEQSRWLGWGSGLENVPGLRRQLLF